MAPVRLDAADRHLLAVAAVWAVVVVGGVVLGAALVGLAVRVFLLCAGWS